MKPIIFSTDMIKAILEGRKNMTRRVMNPQPVGDIHLSEFPNKNALGWVSSLSHKHGDKTAHFPAHKPGDILWVRETWQHSDYPEEYFYKATDEGDICIVPFTWKSPIYMPRTAARLFLRVTDVRVERLRDISPCDCIAEGMEAVRQTVLNPDEYWAWYREIWDSVNAKRGHPWESNPWVWVYTFERIEEEEKSDENHYTVHGDN